MSLRAEIDRKLALLGLKMPAAAAPAANYLPAIRSGDMLYISGQLPMAEGGLVYSGRVDDQLPPQTGVLAAQLCALNILAQAERALGDLDHIRQIVKLTGFVWSGPDFTGQPQIVNGASDLLADLLGERGRHARSAVGVAALPLGAPVEIEAIVAVSA